MPQQRLPTMLTLCNFTCGVLAIYAVFEQKISIAISDCLYQFRINFCFIGWVDSTKLNAVSSFGKELDSLLDIVTFGIAPAILAYQFVLTLLGQIGVGITLFIVICAALRLRRFNAIKVDCQRL